MQAVMRGLKADGVVNCEGTSDELTLAHMGWVFFKVTFEGRSCHSGGKKNGVSAIEKAIKVITALNEMEHDWLLRYKHPLLPPPNLNIGVIKGGSAGSTVPGDCFEGAYRKIREKEVKIVGSMCGCDSRLWRNIAKCPTIQFGPGNLAQFHGIDEWLDVEEFYRTILIYAQLILDWGAEKEA